MDNQQLRGILVKLESRLSDDDRERLHFFLGNDVPRKIRDDSSLRGTLRLMDSLFDQDKINEQDFTFLIHAFEQIQCLDAVNLLKEHRRQILSQSIQSLASIMPITIRNMIEDQCFDKYTTHKSIIDSSDDNVEMIPLNDRNQSQIVEHTINDYSVESTRNKICNRPLRKFKYYFLFILILSITGLASFITLIISRIHLVNQLKHINMTNQVCYQQLTNLVSTYQQHSNRHQLKSNLKWEQNAETVAGGKEDGDELNQLSGPHGIYVSHHQQQTIYIADFNNHRIVKWKLGEQNGQIVAGGNGSGNKIDRLNRPIDVIVDENNKSLIICDRGNKRVVRWSLENQQDKQILIRNINCWGLMMNENGDLFVSDFEKHEVKRWRKGEKNGTIVVGGKGKGDKLNKLNQPTFIFIDRQETIYVSDCSNHRVMKWIKGAKEGIVVAGGGQSKGSSLKQLSCPEGLIVDEDGDVYVADGWNHRITCWSPGSQEGRVVAGGKDEGQDLNQFNYPRGLSFDVENNLYVVDYFNNRIQRFSVDKK